VHITHHAAVVDPVGRHLGDARFPTTSDGYRALPAWLRSFGTANIAKADLAQAA
jgi:transposase